jgi:hypothetical protein
MFIKKTFQQKTFQRENEETENVKASVFPQTENGNRQPTEKESLSPKFVIGDGS